MIYAGPGMTFKSSGTGESRVKASCSAGRRRHISFRPTEAFGKHHLKKRKSSVKKSSKKALKLPPNPEGFFLDIPDAVYRKAPGVSQSLLKPLAISPAHFRHACDHPAKPTAPLIFGRIGHQILLTPKAERFWATKPKDFDGRTAEGRNWAKHHPGKVWVDWATMENILGAVEAVASHPHINGILKFHKREVSVFAPFKVGKAKVKRKGRIDLVPGGTSLCDVKFVEDAREHVFSKQLFDLKWYLQAAYYLDLWNEVSGQDAKMKFVFFAVEKSPPYAVQIYVLDNAALIRGRTEYQDLLKLYVECRSKDEWPIYSAFSPYSEAPKTIGLPKWVNKGQTMKGEFIFG